MPSQRTHIEPSVCVCILWLLKRIVPAVVVVIKSSSVRWGNIGASAIGGRGDVV